MKASNPNRDKQQSGGSTHSKQKQSGDQHVLPLDETGEAPHRPHRMNREDMQKAGEREQDESNS